MPICCVIRHHLEGLSAPQRSVGVMERSHGAVQMPALGLAGTMPLLSGSFSVLSFPVSTAGIKGWLNVTLDC